MRTPTYLLMTLALVMSTGGCDSQGDVAEAQAEGTAAPTGADPAATAALSGDVLVEEHPGGSVTWLIGGDGKVKAAVEVASKPAKDVSGDLLFKAKGGAKKVDLKADGKTQGLFVAEGPKLEHDLTPIDYNLKVEGKPWKGTLHLPPGGTAELVANAKATAEAGFEGKVGPHGGVIQVVGKDILEVLLIEGTGEMRVYLLSPKLEVEAIGDRKITVAIQAEAEAPRVYVLKPEAEVGLYAAANVKLKAAPVRITIAVRPPDVDLDANAKAAARVKVALVGFRPGLRLKVGVKPPRLKVMVKAKAVADFDAKIKADFKAKFDAKAKVDAKVKAGAKAKASVKAPDVKVQKKASASASGGSAKAKASVKIGF
jgi:hypothetical protein